MTFINYNLKLSAGGAQRGLRNTPQHNVKTTIHKITLHHNTFQNNKPKTQKPQYSQLQMMQNARANITHLREMIMKQLLKHVQSIYVAEACAFNTNNNSMRRTI